MPSVSIAPSVTPPNPGVFESISIPVALKVKVKSKTKIKKIEMALGAAVPKKAKVTLTVAKASKKICKVSGGKLVALKPGNCAVTVSVQAPKPKGGKKPKAVKTSGIVAIG